MPLRVLKQLGYEAVFDNFDAPGVIQRLDNNDLLPQVFTIGLKKVTQNKQSLKIVDNQE
ncbi:mucus-binding protein [Lactobacillus gallinarum]|uniref:mucus-binding protein n=1 Tax=Lactobacillus gallinarum TaxID=52242 RepID=UPI0024B17486|nr:mucus-binding protein [Lactobacillus gallinarum]